MLDRLLLAVSSVDPNEAEFAVDVEGCRRRVVRVDRFRGVFYGVREEDEVSQDRDGGPVGRRVGVGAAVGEPLAVDRDGGVHQASDGGFVFGVDVSG